MWMMLQSPQPDDFVVATGEMHTVREFVERSFQLAGLEIAWEGCGVDEKGVDAKSGQVMVEIDPEYFRPTEVELLLGDASKARQILGWEPSVKFPQLVEIMMEEDLRKARYQKYKRNYRDDSCV